MSDPFSLSSSGLAFSPTQVLTGKSGTDAFHGYVWHPVPGQLLQTRGVGAAYVGHIGLRGSLTAEVITGAPGTARALIKVTSEITPPRDTVQLSLDSQNRPVLTIAYNDAATIRVSVPGGPALPAGSHVQVRVVWDSVTPLASGRHVDFTLLSGAPVPGNMGNIPTQPWPMGVLNFVGTGWGTNLGDFNGTILNLQVGDQRM